MQTVSQTSAVTPRRMPWNKGKLTLEQGQADRTEAAASTEARLGHSDAVAAARETWRSSILRLIASCAGATW
jgi:hypothetical protein